MESKKLEKPRENGTFSTVQGVMKPDEEDRGVFPTMKPLASDNAAKAEKPAPASSQAAASAPAEKIDFSNVKIEPLFEEMWTSRPSPSPTSAP